MNNSYKIELFFYSTRSLGRPVIYCNEYFKELRYVSVDENDYKLRYVEISNLTDFGLYNNLNMIKMFCSML